MDDTDDRAGGPEADALPEQEPRRRFSTPVMVLTLVVAGLVCIALVGAFGWYQFARRAKEPIDMVRLHAIHGTDVTIGEGIYDFLKDEGVKIVDEGFKPSWGAEEVARDVWVVSYVYEVGREANWISWKVYPKTGKVVPQGDLAGKLWNGG